MSTEQEGLINGDSSKIEEMDSSDSSSTNASTNKLNQIKERLDTKSSVQRQASTEQKQPKRIFYEGMKSAKTKFLEDATKTQEVQLKSPKRITPPRQGFNAGVTESEPKPRDPNVISCTDNQNSYYDEMAILTQSGSARETRDRFRDLQNKSTNSRNSDIYNDAINGCHIRGSKRLLAGCLDNGGLYIKLGQGLATLNHILPIQYTSTLEQLQDKATAKSFKTVKRVFSEDLGKEPKELFLEFNETPMAAASLAQVHEATLINGDRVAVKVQYFDLQSRFHADIRTIELLLYLVEAIHPSFGFSWVFKDMKETLSQELNFSQEAENSRRCAKDLAQFHDIYVPKVYTELSSKRILTAEYIDGIKINETDQLRLAKVSLSWLDRSLVQAFSYQIFHTGFVHADPHPGNVLVRVTDPSRPQLVILDHGLYEYMTDTLRLHLCGLIKSLIGKDYHQAREHSRALGVEDWQTLGEIVLQRPLDSKKDNKNFRMMKAKLSESDIKYMKLKASEHFDKIMLVLRKMPKPMLLFIRNLNIVRSTCRLHGDPINRYYYMTESAIRASHNYNTQKSGFLSTLFLLFELESFKWKIRISEIKEVFSRLLLDILHYFGVAPSVEEIQEIFRQVEVI